MEKTKKITFGPVPSIDGPISTKHSDAQVVHSLVEIEDRRMRLRQDDRPAPFASLSQEPDEGAARRNKINRVNCKRQSNRPYDGLSKRYYGSPEARNV